MIEERKAGRASKTKPPFPPPPGLAQGLDPPIKYIECKYGGPLGRRPMFCFALMFCFPREGLLPRQSGLFYFAVATSCCVSERREIS